MTPESVRNAHERVRSQLQEVPWESVLVRLDDLDYPASAIVAGSRPASYFAVDDVGVTVTAAGPQPPSLTLRTVANPASVLPTLG